MLLSRSGWALAILATLSVCFIAPDARTALAAVSGQDFPQALLGLASLLQLAISGWVLLIVSLAPLGSPVVRAISPRGLRRALFVGAAGALALSPAHADRGSAPSHAKVEHSLNGLRLPDRPVTIDAIDRSVIVKPGDTLWAIAARSLHAGASDAEIARATARWYDTNRNIIGDNPDLIHPSQHLISPTPTKDAP